jgi:hypothetical protein
VSLACTLAGCVQREETTKRWRRRP